MITEAVVALTDYGLAIECACCSYLMCDRKDRRPIHLWFGLFFGSLGLAALAGGTVHGFFPDEEALWHGVLWRTTLLSLGITALAAWAAGAEIYFSQTIARYITQAAIAGFIVYSVIVLLTNRSFVVAIANYGPAVFFLFVIFIFAYTRIKERKILLGVLGLALTFVAAGVQLGNLALHPVYFNHNALYHLVQAVALLLIFWGAKPVVAHQTIQAR